MEYLSFIQYFAAGFILYASLFVVTSYLIVNLIFDVVRNRSKRYLGLDDNDSVSKNRISTKGKSARQKGNPGLLLKDGW